MTAETDIAAVDDGGANTALEVRTALTSVLARADTVTPGSWMENLFTATTADGDDDEFNDSSLDVAWTTLTVTGSQTITEDRDVLSVSVTGAISDGDFNAIIKPVTLNVGDTWETCIRLISDDVSLGTMAASIVMSDGVVATSDQAMLMVITRDSKLGQVFTEPRSGTFTVSSGATIGPTTKSGFGLHYLRLEYDASNQFVASYSPDGVTFFVVDTFAKTLTPTHVGLGWSTFGDAVNVGIATFEYIRKVV